MSDQKDHRELGYGNVDARPDIESGDPMTKPGDAHEDEKRARPPHGADDGRSGGQHQGGKPAAGNFGGQHSAGVNAQSGAASGSENERTAPGISTDKKADDTK